MSGMITTGDTSISGYGSRTVAIEVTGVCRQDVMKTSNYTIKVPYSRMSQTIQNINRMGGTVANVLVGGATPVVATPSEAPAKTPAETPVKSAKRKKNRNRK